MLLIYYDHAKQMIMKEVSNVRTQIDRVALIAEMARKNISCMRLVELSGVSRVTITAARSGKSCSRETAEKLAAGLGVPVAKIIKEA